MVKFYTVYLCLVRINLRMVLLYTGIFFCVIQCCIWFINDIGYDWFGRGFLTNHANVLSLLFWGLKGVFFFLNHGFVVSKRGDEPVPALPPERSRVRVRFRAGRTRSCPISRREFSQISIFHIFLVLTNIVCYGFCFVLKSLDWQDSFSLFLRGAVEPGRERVPEKVRQRGPSVRRDGAEAQVLGEGDQEGRDSRARHRREPRGTAAARDDRHGGEFSTCTFFLSWTMDTKMEIGKFCS